MSIINYFSTNKSIFITRLFEFTGLVSIQTIQQYIFVETFGDYFVYHEPYHIQIHLFALINFTSYILSRPKKVYQFNVYSFKILFS